MAAAAVLQPSSNLDMSSLPSTSDMSQARQRRRRSTRKTEGSTKPKRQSVQLLGETHLSLDLTTAVKLQVPGGVPVNNVSPFVPESTAESIDNVLTDTASQLTETARQRRRTRLRKQTAQKSEFADGKSLRPQSAGFRALPELEDSTTRVTNLLQENLKSEDNSVPASTKVRGEVPQITTITTEYTEHIAAADEQSENPPLPDRPLPELVPVDTGSVGSHDRELSADILGVTIHETDHLKASVKISHPCVRVTIVDASLDSRGDLLKKSQPDRCVTSFYERGNPDVDYILPVLTQPYKCTDNSESLQPTWEETIVFNERLTNFTDNENVVIFFELLDFSTSSSKNTSRQRTVANSEQTPWYHIAWGFLRPAGKISKSMMGQRSRVQLYKFPKRRFKSSTESKEVFDLWLRHYRTHYPSTLYVTVKALPCESEEELAQTLLGRSLDPTLAEVGTHTFEQLVQKQLSAKSVSSLAALPYALLSETTRLPGQLCHPPTSHLATLHPAKNGCSSLKFSHSGRLLAAGCADNNDLYPVIIYEVPSFQPLLVTEGHKGIVYDMCWNTSDSHLATASADGLVKLWSMSSSSPEPVFILPHPCYVYSVCFASEGLVFTGAYDGNIRLWVLPPAPPTSPQLLCELRGHTGLVNCLVCREGSLYAGDSQGEVGVWKEEQGEWHLIRRISVVKGCALTSMSLHPNGRKLLLHTVKGSIVLLDLRIERVSCEYSGFTITQSQRCSSLISPCGNLVFAAGAPGELHVWNSDTGKLCFSYNQEQLPLKSTVSAVAFHPSEQMAVFSAYGPHESIVVLVQKVDHSEIPAESTRNREKRVKSAVSKDIKTSLKASVKFSEIARTLNNITAFTTSS